MKKILHVLLLILWIALVGAKTGSNCRQNGSKKSPGSYGCRLRDEYDSYSYDGDGPEEDGGSDGTSREPDGEGETEDGDMEEGDTGKGDIEGGDVEGGDTGSDGGDVGGGGTEGGDVEGGDTGEGNTDNGDTEGGDTAGGDTGTGSEGGDSGNMAEPELYFQRVSTFFVCSQMGANCNDIRTVAESVAASTDGNTIVYTDSEQAVLGFVDIRDMYSPFSAGTIDVGGKPTSVAVCGDNAIVVVDTSSSLFESPSGIFHVIDMNTKDVLYTGSLPGQPGSITVSPDCIFAAVVIPQLPAGSVVVMDILPEDPSLWTIATVALTGLDGALYPDEPKPKGVSINSANIAAVSLQDNNEIVLIDLSIKEIIRSFTAGSTNPEQIDTVSDSVIDQAGSLFNELREPDGIVWISDGFFATADGGVDFGGSRSFTVFHRTGGVLYSSGNELEHHAARVGHYNEGRSGHRGTEPETVTYGVFDEDHLLFVTVEQSGLVFAYEVSNPRVPMFRQMLPTGYSPEGVVPIPGRNLLLVASGEDSRENSYRSTINIYAREFSEPGYPTIISSERENGTPLPFSSLSGLSACNFVNYQKDSLPGAVCEKNIVYTIEDSDFRVKRILVIDTSTTPAQIDDEIFVRDTRMVFVNSLVGLGIAEEQIGRLVGEDDTINLDLEGIAVSQTGGWWLVHEGDASTPNLLIKLDENAVIDNVIPLSEEVNTKQNIFGLKGVAEDERFVIVIFQRAWGSDPHPMIGVYNQESFGWGFLFYPLDNAESPNGGWVGLSDIAPLGDGLFLALESDNQAGPDAAVKRIYLINLNEPVAQFDVVTKVLVRDILIDLTTASKGPVVEKVEGLTVDQDGTVWLVNDNDALDGNSGEILFLNLGTATVSYANDGCEVCMNNDCVQCPTRVLEGPDSDGRDSYSLFQPEDTTPDGRRQPPADLQDDSSNSSRSGIRRRNIEAGVVTLLVLVLTASS